MYAGCIHLQFAANATAVQWSTMSYSSASNCRHPVYERSLRLVSPAFGGHTATGAIVVDARTRATIWQCAARVPVTSDGDWKHQ